MSLLLRKKIFSNKLSDENGKTNINSNYINNTSTFKYSNKNIYSIFVKSIMINITGDSDPDMDCYTHCEPLINGINLFYKIGKQKNKINECPIKNLSDFFSIAHPKDINYASWGGGDCVVTIIIDFDKIFGSLIKLSYNDEIIVEVNDDLSSCDKHEIKINGFYLE